MLETPLRSPPEATVRLSGSAVMRGRTVLTIFRLSGELLAVDASAVQEITLMARLSKPSGLPPVIAGFLNMARQPIPIIRLNQLLGLSEPKLSLYTQILILRDLAETPIGWIVDRVDQIVPVAPEDVLSVPENHSFLNCTKGILTRGDGSISILAPDRLLLEQERRCILAFQEKEKERLRELEHADS